MRAASRDLLFICLNTFVVVVSTHKQCNVKPLPSFISIVFNLPKFIVSSTSSSSSKNPLLNPITRSRTLFYLSIRDSSVTPRRGPRRSTVGYGQTVDLGEDEEEGLLGRPGDVSVGMKGLPPRWWDYHFSGVKACL
jgi:hypothetical protein